MNVLSNFCLNIQSVQQFKKALAFYSPLCRISTVMTSHHVVISFCVCTLSAFCYNFFIGGNV